MRIVTTMIMMMLMTACGASMDHLASSIDKATEAAQCDKNSNTNNSSNGASTQCPTASTTTASSTESSQLASKADVLDQTTWITQCDGGIIYKASFAKGEETLTTQIYSDGECQVFQEAHDQYLTYAIRGDEVEFQVGAASVWVDGAPFQEFVIDGDTLTFEENGQVYHSVN